MHHFFISSEAVKDGRITITGPDVNHIKNALRMRAGETLLITTSAEEDFRCRILSIEEKQVEHLFVGLMVIIILINIYNIFKYI